MMNFRIEVVLMYCTLAQAKTQIKASTTTDDSVVWGLIQQASRRVDSFFRSQRPLFAPYIETRSLELNALRIDSTRNFLMLPSPLLALTIITANGTDITADVTVYPNNSANSPYYVLQLTSGNWYQYMPPTSGNTLVSTVLVNGAWGYNPNYTNAWLSVDTLSANITSSATSLTVADVDGADAYGMTPRISAGNIIRIDSEYMLVTATNTTTNVCTVIRAYNGSTASAHTSTTAVYTYQVDLSINRAVSRQVGLMYARRGSYENSTITDLTTVSFPADVLLEWRAIMNEMAYV